MKGKMYKVQITSSTEVNNEDDHKDVYMSILLVCLLVDLVTM